MQIERLIRRYLLASPENQRGLELVFPLPISVLKAMYSDIIESLNNRRCPECGKMFRYKYAATVHLIKKHPYIWMEVLHDSAETYVRLTTMMERVHKNRYSVRIGSIRISGSRSEIARYILKHPEILRQL
jgi:hypothetical protein